jgi:hypothetical protein
MPFIEDFALNIGEINDFLPLMAFLTFVGLG